MRILLISKLILNRIDKVKSYLLIGLFEVCLIVGGILIAINIEDHYAENEKLILEKKLLVQLRSEASQNIAQLETKIKFRNNIMRSAELLFLFSKNEDEKIPLDTLSYHLGAVQFEPTFDPVEGAIIEILNGGKISLIKNAEIRNWIANWQSKKIDLKETEQLMVDNVNNRFQPYMDATYNKRKYSKVTTNLDIINSYALGSSISVSIESNLNRTTLYKILNDQYVQNFLLRTSRHALIANKISTNLIAELTELISIVNSELENK